jgi:hypothetical protein
VISEASQPVNVLSGIRTDVENDCNSMSPQCCNARCAMAEVEPMNVETGSQKRSLEKATSRHVRTI